MLLNRNWLRLLSLLPLLVGCVTNPVTGKREAGWVSTERQIAIGQQHYAPALQMQGGRYLVHPELSTYVNDVGQRVAASSPAKLPYEFTVLNSSVPNAWALPGGKIAINRGLLTELRNEAELAAVLGHEAAHAGLRHGAKSMERGMLLQGALIAAAIGTRSSEYAGSMLGVAQVAAGLITSRYGRNAEREADYYGTDFMAASGYDPYGAVSLQETFVRLSEAKGNAGGGLDGLFASHPPSAERVANNKSIVPRLREEYPQATNYGSENFEQAMRQLRRDAPAYAAYDDARKALAEDEFDDALGLVKKAISLQPAEPMFHGLRGDVRYAQERYRQAETNYGRAIERDDQFFGHYIGRGMARKRNRNPAAAKADLQQSLKLLPTAVAYKALGEIAESEGNDDEAVRYYQAASQAKNEVGRTAYASLLRLDLPKHPQQYIASRIVRDDRQRWVLQVRNNTQVAVTNVQVQVDLLATDGSRGSLLKRVRRIEPGATQLLLLAELSAQQSEQIADAQTRTMAATVSQ